MRPTWIRTLILLVFGVGIVWLVGVPAGTAEDAAPVPGTATQTVRPFLPTVEDQMPFAK